jgi:hypothetical protein
MLPHHRSRPRCQEDAGSNLKSPRRRPSPVCSRRHTANLGARHLYLGDLCSAALLGAVARPLANRRVIAKPSWARLIFLISRLSRRWHLSRGVGQSEIRDDQQSDHHRIHRSDAVSYCAGDRAFNRRRLFDGQAPRPHRSDGSQPLRRRQRRIC